VPQCLISGAKYVPSVNRFVGQGSCWYVVRQVNGKLKKLTLTGRKWAFSSLKVYDYNGSICVAAGAKSGGLGNDPAILPKGANRVVATFKLWVSKSRSHKASKVAVKTITKVIGGSKSTTCSGAPTIITEGSAPPPGQGSVCGLEGRPVVDASGVHIPALRCGGNGSCVWAPLGGSYSSHGYVVYPGTVICQNGFAASPTIMLKFTYDDGTTCQMSFGGIAMLPLTSGWLGSLTVTVDVLTFDSSGKLVSTDLPPASAGPFQGTGKRVCP